MKNKQYSDLVDIYRETKVWYNSGKPHNRLVYVERALEEFVTEHCGISTEEFIKDVKDCKKYLDW